MLTEINYNTPRFSDPFKDIYSHIRDIKERFGERFGLDHYIGSSQDTSLATADGNHKQLTMNATTISTTSEDYIIIHCKEVDGVQRLIIKLNETEANI